MLRCPRTPLGHPQITPQLWKSWLTMTNAGLVSRGKTQMNKRDRNRSTRFEYPYRHLLSAGASEVP